MKFNKQLIILISGFSGSGKSKLGDFLADLFKIKHIKLTQFQYPPEIYDKPENYIEVVEGTKVLDWDNLKSINWNDFNQHVDINKKNGLIITGFGFPQQNIKFNPNFHLHVKISKQNLINKRHAYLEEHPEDKNNEWKGTEIETKILNKITYPHYIKYLEEGKPGKFINATDDIMIQQEAFDYLMAMIQKWLEQYNKKVIMDRDYKKEETYDGFNVIDYDGKGYIYDRFHSKGNMYNGQDKPEQLFTTDPRKN